MGLADLFGPQEVAELAEVITGVLARSFQEANMRNPTQSEVRRRTDICLRWAAVFRGDLHWGKQRIWDTLPVALRCELLGQKYEPSTRKFWLPEDGQ